MAIQTLDEIRDFKGKYPKQLWYLFLSEMWERFCFYGMRGVLTVFMVEKLLMSEKDANMQYGAIQAFVYTMTFVGGFFADKILGFRKSIFWGGLLMVVGSFTIAFAPGDLFYIGTSISIVGTGFFKPNISGVVGMLYRDGDIRRDAGFALFYSGINVGALLGGYLCFNLGNNYGWEYAFGVAGLAMMVGLAIFGFTQHTLGPLGFSPLLEKQGMDKNRASIIQALVLIGSLVMIPFILLLVKNPDYTAIFMYIVGPGAVLYLIYEMTQCTKEEVRKLMAALIFIVFSIFFWAFFEQSGGSLSLVARYHVTEQIAGVNLNPNEVNNTANSLFVILMSPLFGLLWMALHKRKAEPNTVVKFGLGFLFLAAAFYVFHMLINYSSAEGISSLTVFAMAYLIITIGELCLSPIGLSAMTKLSPRRLIGIIMGLWFLASAYGQYFAGILGAGMSSTGEYKVKTEQLPTHETSVVWADTATNTAEFKMMEVTYAMPNADTLELKWQRSTADPKVELQISEKGDTVMWRYMGTANDGKETLKVPAGIMANIKSKASVEPASIERLGCYTDGYRKLALYATICGLALILISPLVRRLMGEVK
jgi:proton-dependent oligopeptide transporter, POT family